jgi:alkylhydroperoxidase/carboxymuconolactone decarboxylase family protein YurZ
MAQHYLECETQFIDDIKNDYRSADISEKLKALLTIAASVKRGGKFVTTAQVDHARKQGATDMEIHDTVLIAAAFCMFNRYVDGLATWAPEDKQVYIQRAPVRAEEGYANFDLFK